MTHLQTPKRKILIKCFNTDLVITINETEEFNKIVKTISSTAKSLHNSFNIYDEKSEIYELNLKRIIVPSEYLNDILQTAVKYEKLSNYYFNTNQQFKEEENIKFDSKYIRIKNKIDLGGIAKGYFMSLIKDFLKNKNLDYKIDFGGALMFENETNIKLRDIQDPNSYLLKLNINNDESIHTSSFYWQINGENSHIYQKKIKYKKINKSVSVIDQNPILADALSTALYSMDFLSAQNFIKQFNLKVIYILDKSIYISKKLENYELLKNEYEIIKI